MKNLIFKKYFFFQFVPPGINITSPPGSYHRRFPENDKPPVPDNDADDCCPPSQRRIGDEETNLGQSELITQINASVYSGEHQ